MLEHGNIQNRLVGCDRSLVRAVFTIIGNWGRWWLEHPQEVVSTARPSYPVFDTIGSRFRAVIDTSVASAGDP